MTTTEAVPRREESEEAAEEAPRLEAPIERWVEGEDTTRREVLENRALAVETMMDKGIPKTESYENVWQSFGSYLKAVERREVIDEVLSGHLANQRKAEAFRELISLLHKGESFMEMLAKEEKGPPHPTRLAALEMFREALQGAAATDGGKIREGAARRDWNQLDGAEGEATKRMLRMAEIGTAEGMTSALKHKLVPKNQVSAVQVATVERWEALRQSADVPEVFRKERAREAIFELSTQYETKEDRRGDQEPAPRRDRETATSEEQSRPERVEKARKPITVFGREMVTNEDFVALKQDVLKLAQEGTPEGAYKLARQLAHMKRAKIEISRGFDKVKAHLDSQREAVAKLGGKALAQYLTYQRYLDPTMELREEDARLIWQDINNRAVKGDITELSAEIMNAYYLGVFPKPLPERFQEGFEGFFRTVNERVKTAPEEVALQLARARATGIEVHVDQETKELLQARLDSLRQEQRWGDYVRLHDHLVRLRSIVSQPDQRACVAAAEGLLALRSRGTEHVSADGRTQYVRNVADLASLERYFNRPSVELAQAESELVVATEEVVTEVLPVINSGDFKSPAERLRKRRERHKPGVERTPRSAKEKYARGYDEVQQRLDQSAQQIEHGEGVTGQPEGIPVIDTGDYQTPRDRLAVERQQRMSSQEQRSRRREWTSAKEKYGTGNQEGLQALGQQEISSLAEFENIVIKPHEGPISAVDRQGYQTPAERWRAERAGGGFFSRWRQRLARFIRGGDEVTANDEYVARQFQQRLGGPVPAEQVSTSKIEMGDVQTVTVAPERKPMPVDIDEIKVADAETEANEWSKKELLQWLAAHDSLGYERQEQETLNNNEVELQLDSMLQEIIFLLKEDWDLSRLSDTIEVSLRTNKIESAQAIRAVQKLMLKNGWNPQTNKRKLPE